MQVDFYHLGTTPVERVLPRLAERVLADGGRLIVVAGDAERAKRIDLGLWDYKPESFLAHGVAGGEADAVQPILIALELGGAGDAPANGARNLALADGVWRDAALGFERVFHLFDDATVADARTAWRTLGTQEGLVRNFWRQEDGRWTKAA